MVIGSVVLSPGFFAIYMGESEQHVATLEREMARSKPTPSRR